MRKYEDSYQHKGLRKQLINVLKDKGITAMASGFSSGFIMSSPRVYRLALRGRRAKNRHAARSMVTGEKADWMCVQMKGPASG